MRKKSFKSALTVLLSLMMILVMFPANAFAMDGEGTKENPYIIATADDLYEFAIKVNEGDNTACAVLTADITLLIDTNWTPIGNDSNQYKGTFDGDGHTITGLKVDIQSDNTIYAGLFGFLGEGGTIKNVSLTDSKITCSGNRVFAGGVCGRNYGTIENCYNTGDVSGTGTSSYGYVSVGGVCGWSYNTGEVSGTGTSSYGYVYAGGVCGYNDLGTIQNCYFLFGTADKAVSINNGTVDNVEEKSAEAFASGEVAWLLNEPQTEKPWGQGSNNMPVLEGNLPDGVTSKTPVRITIVMQDNSEQYRYTTEGSTVAEYPTGYAFFFKDGDTKTWISKGTQTYDADATIYAENMPLEKIQAKAPTCTESGNSKYWYSAAYDKYFSDENGVNEITAASTVIPATGHGESEVKGAKEATCTEDGYTGDKVCKVCGEILERGTVIEKLGHVWGEPEWSWSEDGKTCTVTFTCKNNPEHKETPEADVTSEVKTPATCTESGVTTYTATVEFNGKTYTDTKDVADLAATGHSYGEPVWSWSEDGTSCTVTFTCANDETHKESPEVTVTSDVKTPATCTETGVTTYTATVEFNGQTYTDTKDVADIPAIGHSYEDGKCTVCGATDPNYKPTESDNGNSDSSVTGETTSPETGDNSNMMLWIAVMLAAGTTLTGTILYSRKRKYSR